MNPSIRFLVLTFTCEGQHCARIVSTRTADWLFVKHVGGLENVPHMVRRATSENHPVIYAVTSVIGRRAFNAVMEQSGFPEGKVTPEMILALERTL